MGQARNAAAIVALIALAGTCCAATATAKPGKSQPTVKVTIAGISQKKLTATGRVRAKVRSSDDARVRLKLVIHQAKLDRRITKRNPLKVKAGRPAKQRLKLTDRGANLVRSCVRTKLELVTKVGKRKVGAARPKMKRDPAHCDGSTPLGVALDTADRCDPITPVGTECLFPYPNDHFTRADSSTDTGLRLNLQTESMPANASGKHIDPTDVNTSDGFSPGAPIVTHVPGLDTPEAFARTGRRADHPYGPALRRRSSRSCSSTPPPASGS